MLMEPPEVPVSWKSEQRKTMTPSYSRELLDRYRQPGKRKGRPPWHNPFFYSAGLVDLISGTRGLDDFQDFFSQPQAICQL